MTLSIVEKKKEKSFEKKEKMNAKKNIVLVDGFRLGRTSSQCVLCERACVWAFEFERLFAVSKFVFSQFLNLNSDLSCFIINFNFDLRHFSYNFLRA